MGGGSMKERTQKEINIIVGQNIRLYREQKRYTREKLAELIDVSPGFLYDAEHGFVGISLTTLKRLCQVLGVSADAILWENHSTDTTLTQRLAHVDEKYLPFIEEIIQKQLELIALFEKETPRPTRN